MTFSITVLGCSGSYAARGGACSGYLVRSGTTSIWLDTGPGTLANVQEHVDLNDIDAIVVSHQHPDHCGELPVLYNAYKWYLQRVDVPVFATRGVEKTVRASCDDTNDVFSWTFLTSGDSVDIGDITLMFEATDHTVETMAVRCEHGGASIVYTADTGPRWDLAAFAKSCDILMGEGTVLHRDRPEGYPHLSSHELGARAAAGEVGRLVVTHIAPGSDDQAHLTEASKAFGRQAELAVVHKVYTV